MALAEAASVPQVRRWRRRRGGVPLVAVVFLVAVALMALLAPWISPHDPLAGTISDALQPPAWKEGGSTAHLLGTDQLGRDVLSRLIQGSRITLMVAMGGVAVAGVIGSLLGIVAGYAGGLLDELIMRLADAALAIPLLVLGLALAAILGTGVGNVIIVVAALTWAFFARLVRGETLRLRNSDYVVAARLTGLKSVTIMRRHILPNVLSPILVMATLQVGNTVIVAASLSFLGLGVPQPTPEWGLMLADAQDYMSVNATLLIAPGALLAMAVLSSNLLGDWLRDRFDPHGRTRLR